MEARGVFSDYLCLPLKDREGICLGGKSLAGTFSMSMDYDSHVIGLVNTY